MPKIPTHIQGSEAQGAFPNQVDIGQRGAGLGNFGEGLRRVAGVMIHVQEQDAAADAALKLARTQSEWQATLLKRQEEAEPGAPEFTPTLLKDYDEYTEQTAATLKTRTAQNFYREGAARTRGALSGNALQFESKSRIEHRSSQYQEAAELVATSAELDPDNYKVSLAEQLAALDMVDVPPIEKLALRKGTIDLVQTRAAIGYARRDPEEAMKRLTMPAADDALFRSLTPKARDHVLQEIESTQRTLLAMEDREYRNAERAERDMYDSASKNGDKMLAEGKLTSAWLEQNRNRMSPDDYRYFYRSLSGEGSSGPRDVQAYADMRERAGQGQDVRTEAREALTRGQIGASDFDRILGEVEGQRPGWYKRGSDFISTSAAVSDLNPDPAAAQRKAAMLDDWNDWADDNTKATDTEAREAYKRIVEEYAIVDTRKFTLTKRAPQFLAGDRVKPDLDATEDATVAALERGDLTPDEFEQQAALIAEWRSALRDQEQQKAKK